MRGYKICPDGEGRKFPIWCPVIRINIKIMTVKELLNEGSNVQLIINASDLKVFSDTLINEAVERFAKPKEETYITAEQATRILHVQRNTLWRWEKENYLVPVRFGTKVRYKMSDINKILGKEW